jgi:glycosyltransferase involved in cell wall biosynthesis
MRILSITAGAAGMYCGSCARDNSVARELMRLGHDVTLVPVYTPTRTDEPNVSRPRVLFGGISVYLQQYVPLFRWTPPFLDRLWDSPAVISRFAGRAVSNDPKLLGELTISMLSGRSGVLHKEFGKFLDWLGHEPAPEVINLPNSLLVSMADPLREAFRAPVTCTLQGEELFIDGLASPYREEALRLIRGSVPRIDRFIAVSEYAAEYMCRYLEIPPDKVSVVPLGINMEGYGPGNPAAAGSDAPFRIGYFARIAPEKGFRELVEAYVRLRRMHPESPARLEAAGYTSPDNTAYLDMARTVLRQAGLEDEFHYHGVVDREGKIRFLQNLDVLSVPATYDEPKGLFLIEAMANGVPVVQPRRGAFTEVVEKTGGGILVEPDDIDSLVEGLRDLWQDPLRRVALGSAAEEGVREHYTVTRSAESLVRVYETALSECSHARAHAGSL